MNGRLFAAIVYLIPLCNAFADHVTQSTDMPLSAWLRSSGFIFGQPDAIYVGSYATVSNRYLREKFSVIFFVDPAALRWGIPIRIEPLPVECEVSLVPVDSMGGYSDPLPGQWHP
jgi:hypothetical protein